MRGTVGGQVINTANKRDKSLTRVRVLCVVALYGVQAGLFGACFGAGQHFGEGQKTAQKT